MSAHPAGATAAILESVAAMGIPVTREEADVLSRHLEMVFEVGKTMNLTRVLPEDAPTLHVADSLAGLRAMSAAGEGPWADLGSGAGFPGIPLCVCGHRRVVLIESIGKKARFLSDVCASLRLDATVRDVRAEEAAREFPDEFSAVSARAVGDLSELVELASPLLRIGGVFVAWKGALQEAERDRGERAALVAGLTLTRIQDYVLPETDKKRCVVVFEKRREPSVRLPRRIGAAKAKPLG